MNYLAIVAAAASSFALGGLWYSPAMFGRIWTRESGVEEQQGHAARVFGVAFAFSLVAALGFAYLLGPNPQLEVALRTGLVVGIAFVAASFGINYQFAQRSSRMWLVDAGYHVAQFLLFALIIGLWH